MAATAHTQTQLLFVVCQNQFFLVLSFSLLVWRQHSDVIVGEALKQRNLSQDMQTTSVLQLVLRSLMQLTLEWDTLAEAAKEAKKAKKE